MLKTVTPKFDMQNLLLAALPKSEFAKIEHSLKLVNLKVGQVLWEMNEKRRYVYFPTSALVCFLYQTENVNVTRPSARNTIESSANISHNTMPK